MKAYDVVVIGGGPGGYTAAVRCSQLGLKTAVVERESFGGTCANWGCIPTKALVRNAEVARLLHEGRTFGFEGGGGTPSYAAAQSRSRQVARRQEKRVEALLKSRSVEIIRGEGRIQERGMVVIHPSEEVLSATAIIIAVGGKPRTFPGLEPDGGRIVTSRDALGLKVLPARAVVVGAGPIGMEFASVWNSFGSKVTLLEAMPFVLPLEDEEISREMAAQYERAGIAVKTGVRVQSVINRGDAAEIVYASGQEQQILEADTVLVSVGTLPDLADLGLDGAGVCVERGVVVVDAAMRTNVPGIYAIGDATGIMPLAHTASAQAAVAAEAIAGKKVEALVYENIPRCVFGMTEAASVGLTERQAIERGFAVRVVKSPFLPNGKAVAINENYGFVKLVAAESGRLLGAHMVGPHVTELIGAAAVVVSLAINARDAAKVVFPHPTLGEAFMEGLHALAGHAAHL